MEFDFFLENWFKIMNSFCLSLSFHFYRLGFPAKAPAIIKLGLSIPTIIKTIVHAYIPEAHFSGVSTLSNHQYTQPITPIKLKTNYHVNRNIVTTTHIFIIPTYILLIFAKLCLI